MGKKVIIPEREIDALPIVSGGANDVVIREAGPGSLHVGYSGLNSVLPCCEVNGGVNIDIRPNGVHVTIGGDDYPNVEVVQYRPGMEPRFLGRDRAGWAGGTNAVPVTLPRFHSWIEGQCTLELSCDSSRLTVPWWGRVHRPHQPACNSSEGWAEMNYRQRPSRWWYAVPAGLLVFVLIGVWFVRGTSIAGVGDGATAVGPGETVRVIVEPGRTYRVYQHASAGQLGRDCRLDADGGQAAGLRFGLWRSWSDVVYGSPRTLLRDGQEYGFALQFSHERPVGITVSCVGGPVLVQTGQQVRPAVVLGLGVAVLVMAALTGGVAWARRSRPAPGRYRVDGPGLAAMPVTKGTR